MSAKKSGAEVTHRDSDLANAEVAIIRAVRKVRERAKMAGVPLVYVKDGEIVEEVPGKKSSP